MFTIFTIPKSFEDKDTSIIQKNAIRSWKRLHPKCEVILFGDEKGVKEAAEELGVSNIPIDKNEFGTPLLSSAFNLAKKTARNNILIYVNSDIILLPEVVSAIQKIDREKFLMSGRRLDTDVKEEIDFTDSGCEKRFLERIAKRGILHGFSGIDYFIFPRHLSFNLPSFAVGRPCWDNWLIHHARLSKIPVIDATEAVLAIHQNHESSHKRIKKDPQKQKEADKNFKLAGGFINMCTLRDADFILTQETLRKTPYPRKIFSDLSLFYPWRALLSIKRKIKMRK